MPAKKKKLECGHTVFVSRSDTKYCSDRCRQRLRQEDAKFEIPVIPRSGIQGVTFNRTTKRWEIRIREGSTWKYIGRAKQLQNAIKLRNEVLAVSV